ncbi:MAG: YbaK/EbsC family protein [Patescibacteria group bacterium]|nr:YbaK/EbsC family protein [Patescibacteria group bacterium]
MPKKKTPPVKRKKFNGAGKKPKAKIKKQIKAFENSITKLLTAAKVKFGVIEHKVVYTAHDAAQTTKKKLAEIAKVVLVKADKSFVLIVLPAGKYVDFSGIKKALHAKKVSMATEKDITKYLKTKVGLLHPFGHLYKLQTLLDKSMAKAKKIVASAGSYTHSIEISPKDFEKLVKPIKGAFAKAKK